MSTDWQPGDPVYPPPEPLLARCMRCDTRWDVLNADECPTCPPRPADPPLWGLL